MPFTSFGLSEQLLTSLKDQGYKEPYPIQSKAIPSIMDGKDLLGIAKTGSGKTASFVLPILNTLRANKKDKNRHVKVLVLVPTRELAIQVQEVFYQFGKNLGPDAKSMAVYGGISINPQMKKMMGVQILVATPGRLLELLEHKAVFLSRVETLVIDEADKMLNLGFKEAVGEILSLLPEKRQNLLFSATLSKDVKNINQIVLRDPEVVKIEEEIEPIEQIKQIGYWVSDNEKGPLLRHLINSKMMKQVLIFTSSVYKADNVADKLRKNGIDAKAIHSKKSQGARKESLDAFKRGELRVLVATDLLSRGIDIDNLPYVINYELPRSPKDFVHRIGRTGRAESSGEALTFVTEEDKHHFKVIQKKMKRWVDMVDSSSLDMR